MTWMHRLNNTALDSYLRGEYGGDARRVAQQELLNRATMTTDEMVEHLQQRGYGIISPDDMSIDSCCPWCGATALQRTPAPQPETAAGA